MGVSEAKKSLRTQHRPQISCTFDKFHFLPLSNFSGVVGWVGWAGLARAPNNLSPHPPRVFKQ